MDLFTLTRTLVDIESVTNNEKQIAEFLFNYLSKLAQPQHGNVERMQVDSSRFNVFASWGRPIVTLSTHMDTVPPFFPSREDDGFLWGRGACDAKGIIGAMLLAAAELLADGVSGFALLFVVGEEHGSAGACAAAKVSRGSRYLVNGEPTENKVAIASKGVLRFELKAQGRLAHSAYPELGQSAIESLLDVLQQIRALALPQDPILGETTMNIGTISGGRAHNVIADEARAEISIRLVGDAAPIRCAIRRITENRVQAVEVLHTPVSRLSNFDGLPTTVVAFASDIGALGTSWGIPFLIGPGSIHVAHTAGEFVSKRELRDAVTIYSQMVRRLLSEKATESKS